MNTYALHLIDQINATGIRSRATSSLKSGLRNVIQDCRELGHGSGGAIEQAEKWLAKLNATVD